MELAGQWRRREVGEGVCFCKPKEVLKKEKQSEEGSAVGTYWGFMVQ